MRPRGSSISLVSLDRQLTHVAHNLSSYFSPNTHLSGEALALYAVSTAFPELRRSAARAGTAGRTILLREAESQVRADGGHAELSAHYHRYSTDFYLLALMVARASGDAARRVLRAGGCETGAATSGRSRTTGDACRHSGTMTAGSCSDSAEVAPADASVSLGVAASLLRNDALAVAPVSEETWWILGGAPNASLACARTMAVTRSARERLLGLARDRTAAIWCSTPARTDS